jgi:2-(1,2-epoxy-1,2-dihydrophenyl)acetyl-CoA isomerase
VLARLSSRFRRLYDLDMPIVTAVNGRRWDRHEPLMGDLIVAAQPLPSCFPRIGLVPDGGITWLLPRLIGLARARSRRC